MLENTVILTLFFSWLYLSVLVHAVMRTMIGRLLGFKVYQVWVGSGERRWSTSISGVPWHFRPFPFGGYSHLQPKQMPGLRWRGALVTLVVLAVDLSMMWAFVHFWPGIGTYFSRENEGPLSVFSIFTLFIRGVDMFIHLLPVRIFVDDVRYPTEGKLLLEYVSGTYANSWALFFEARKVYQESVARYDPEFIYRGSWLQTATLREKRLFADAHNELYAGNHRAFIEKSQRLLMNPELAGGERARCLDLIALAAIDNDNDVAPEQALEWVREAQALAPHARPVHRTLGAVLVATGAYTEAIEILTPLTTAENEDWDRSFSSAFLAIAYDKQGDAHQAAMWLSSVGKHVDLEKLRSRILAELSPEAQSLVV